MTHTRLTTIWTGWQGAPGYTRMSFEGTLDDTSLPAAVAATSDFWEAMKAYIPTSVHLTMTGTAEIYDINGEETGQLTYTPPAATVGTGTNVFYSAAGAVVIWKTSTYDAGRRIQGRSFLVPLSEAMESNTGGLIPAAVAAILGGATALWAGPPNMIIFSQKGGPGTPGIEAVVTGANVPATGGVLRSRRD